jgi:hypothetical protein
VQTTEEILKRIAPAGSVKKAKSPRGIENSRVVSPNPVVTSMSKLSDSTIEKVMQN